MRTIAEIILAIRSLVKSNVINIFMVLIVELTAIHIMTQNLILVILSLEQKNVIRIGMEEIVMFTVMTKTEQKVTHAT